MSPIEDIALRYTYIFIGRVSEEKGVDLFCEALTKVKCDKEK